MKILYFSDDYAYNVMGTKRSFFGEMKRRGYEMIWVFRGLLPNVMKMVEEYKPDQIWLAHSNLSLPINIKIKLTELGITVVGFGFSDPYYFSVNRFSSSDIYVTNNIYIFSKYRNDYNLLYNPTACDLDFHKNLNLKKDIDISIIGLGRHPRFVNKAERIEIINKLRDEFPDRKIYAYGRSWPVHKDNYPYITGNKFLEVINRSKIGLDIQDSDSPLAHRMFEYLACGTPIITRKRPEVFLHFREDEILTYSTREKLLQTITHYLKNEDKLKSIAIKGNKRVIKEHDIKNRVDLLEVGLQLK